MGNQNGSSSMIEPELIDSKTLAKLLSVSVKFIEKHRKNIVGSRKIGRNWRFNIANIRSRITTGKDIIVKPVVPSQNIPDACHFSGMGKMIRGKTGCLGVDGNHSGKKIMYECSPFRPVPQGDI